jgi:hypothetical protein
MSQANRAEPWREAMDAQIAAAAEAYPEFSVVFQDAAQDNADQVSDVENLLTQGIDLLIISPNEAAPLNVIVKEAWDSCVPVIVLARNLVDPNYSMFIGADNVAIGAAAGKYAADWCAANGVRLVSDEIYHGITYTEATVPTAAHLRDSGAIVVSSFSKYWAMTGWRLGWMVLPDDLVAPVDALAGNFSLCPPTLAQHAGIAALSPAGMAAARQDVAGFATSRDLLLARMPELGWTDVAPADGAFYLYADVSASGIDSITWCARLLDEAGVALTPGTDFDPVDGHRTVRLSFAAGIDVVREAVDRIIAWQQTLTG